MRRFILATGILVLLACSNAALAALYFPHSASDGTWETEIAVINTSGSASATGTLRAFSDSGQEIGNMAITLPAHGRTQMTIGSAFSNPSAIGYLVLETTSQTVCGYTKFSISGNYRVSVPAACEVNTRDIFISHIASDSNWWTGVSLVNTTSSAKTLTLTFNTGAVKTVSLAANEHKAFTIASLFNGQPPANLQSAVISGGIGVVGLELFGSTAGSSSNYLSGVLLKDQKAATLHYPHIANDAQWWTGIVAYNPAATTGTLTITPYTAAGAALSPQSVPIEARGKYVGNVADLNLPAGSAWLRIQGTSGMTGFELFGTHDGQQLAGYTAVGISGRERIFAKKEKSGWTGIAFVNTEATAAMVTLTAYNDSGAVVAARTMSLGAHAKVADNAENIFSPDSIASATYIGYAADRELVGFQLNGSSDGLLLDALPGIGGGSIISPSIKLARVDFSTPPTAGQGLTMGYVDVPFTQDQSARKYINVVIDLNGDGTWASYAVGNDTQKEWVVQNMAARIDPSEPNAYSFAFYDKSADGRTGFKGKAVLTDAPINAASWDGTSPQNPLAELNFTVAGVDRESLPYSPTPGYTSGFSASGLSGKKPLLNGVPSDTVIKATGASFSVFNGGVPDINQDTNECVPTSVANSLRWLAEKNGYTDKLPESDEELIEELKTDFKWTPTGVDTDTNFIPGKTQFATDHKLPIETHMIGVNRDPDLIDKIKEEIDKGQAIEMAIYLWEQDATGTWIEKGGHMVCVVGAFRADGVSFLDFHDPGRASLLDTYRVGSTPSGILTLDYALPNMTTIEDAWAQSPVTNACSALNGLRIVLTNTGVRGDLSHLPFTGNPILNNMLLFSVLQTTLAISGAFPFVAVSGAVDSGCNFNATGRGTVAGRPNVSVRMTGSVTNKTISGSYTMGAGGELPGGQPIIFDYSGALP